MSVLARKVAVNTSLYALGRVVVSAVGVVATAVATRYLGPEQFGMLTTAVVFVTVMGLMCDLGLWVVTVRELARKPEDARRLLANAFGLGIVLSIVAFVAAIALMGIIYPGASRAPVREAIVLLAAGLLLSAPAGVASAHLMWQQRAGPAVAGNVVSSLVLIGVLAVASAAEASLLVVAGAYFLQSLVNGLVPLAFVRRAIPFRIRRDSEVWRLLFSRAVPQAAVLILTTVYFRIDTIIVSLLSTDREVGLYGVGYRVLEGLIILPVLFMTTLFPELARQDHRTERLAELVQHAVSTILVGVVPVVIVVVVFAGEIVEIIAGSGYADATSVLAYLTIAVGLNAVVTVFFQTLVAVGEQAGLARAMVIVLVVNLGLNALLVPGEGARGAALALVASEVAALALVLVLIGRVVTRPRLYRPLRLALASALAAGAGIGVLALLDGRTEAFVVLAAGAAGVFAVYGVALLLLRAIPNSLDMLAAPIERRLGLRPPAGGP